LQKLGLVVHQKGQGLVGFFWGLLFGRRIKDAGWLYGKAAKRNGLRLSRSLAEGLGVVVVGRIGRMEMDFGFRSVSKTQTTSLHSTPLPSGGKSIVGHTHFELVHFVCLMWLKRYKRICKIHRNIQERIEYIFFPQMYTTSENCHKYLGWHTISLEF